MSPSLDIRRGGPRDLVALASLLRGAGLPTADLNGITDLHVWLVEAKDALVGAIALERFGREALLRSLAVAPEYRKLGVGQRLVARLEEDARGEGGEQLFLLTETARDFFLRLRYAVVDRSSASDALRQSAEFRSLCPVSAVCMSKSLSGLPEWNSARG